MLKKPNRITHTHTHIWCVFIAFNFIISLHLHRCMLLMRAPNLHLQTNLYLLLWKAISNACSVCDTRLNFIVSSDVNATNCCGSTVIYITRLEALCSTNKA